MQGGEADGGFELLENCVGDADVIVDFGAGMDYAVAYCVDGGCAGGADGVEHDGDGRGLGCFDGALLRGVIGLGDGEGCLRSAGAAQLAVEEEGWGGGFGGGGEAREFDGG